MHRALATISVLIGCLTLATTSHAARLAPASRAPLPAPMPNIVHGDCPDEANIQGCADATGDAVYIMAGLPQAIRYHTVLHELGHIVDARYLDNGERNRFESLLSLKGPWWHWRADLGDMSRSSPGEQFADAYAHCHVGDVPARWRGKDGLMRYTWWDMDTRFEPTAGVYRQVCGFIQRAMHTPA